VGALSVLIIDKQADIQILTFMGADRSLIARIFLLEGFMVTMSGTVLGLVLGSLIVWLQGIYGIIPMQGSFAIDSFPVELLFSDIAAVFAVVIVVSLLAVIYPIRRLSKTLLVENNIK
jgi:lipoprotein-releasing system permease protein